MVKKFRLTEALAGKPVGTEFSSKRDAEVWEWKYKGTVVILRSDSELLLDITTPLAERVNTIEDVYRELNRKMPTLDDYQHVKESKRERALNTQYIDDITELFNEGWIPDFNDRTQYKYYPYFVKNSASGWVLCGVSGYRSGSNLGSGFYYKNREIATLCANKFLSIYKKVLD